MNMRRAIILLALLAGLGAATAHAQDATTTTDGTTTAEAPPSLIADGVTIAGVSVGGLTAEEATTAVQTSFVQPFTFTFRANTWQASPARAGASADIAGAVANALIAAPLQAVSLPYTVNALTLRAYVRRLANRYGYPAVNSRVYLRGLRPFVTRSRLGVAILQRDTRILIRQAFAARTRGPIELPSRVLQPRITRSNFGPVIVIRRASHRLYLYRVMSYWRTFGVAVGRPEYPTPLGRFHIAVKQRNPWWYPPDSSWAAGASPIPPGPGNPLGTRWMGLSAGGVGIHGTPDAASIGYSASHGCIRMRIPDAEWLFERVRVGTTVFIVSA
jgi:lipoprotein-anchoring transpeptidase ErfK/SrfK